MKDFIKRLIKYLIILIIVLFITSAIVIVISKFIKLKLSDLFLYTGLIYIAIGLFSFVGNVGGSSNYNNVQNQSMYKESVYDASLENMKSKDSSSFFLVFMSIIGIILFLISYLLIKKP